MGEAGIGDEAAAEVEQAEFFGVGEMGEAVVADFGVEQREIRQLRQLGDEGHAFVR